MKKVTIIGAGITGLRAARELVQSGLFRVVLVDKSPSVGGRVATRRFDHTQVNHGAKRFDGLERVLKADPVALEMEIISEFYGAATELPKKLRDHLLPVSDRFTLKTNWQVKSVSEGTVVGPGEEKLSSDYVIITAPIPQVESMCQCSIANVEYTKCVLFIGERNEKAVRIEMDADWSAEHFDESDDDLFTAAECLLVQDLTGLSLKKWRYARVKHGLSQWYFHLSGTQFVAGDAFDPEEEHDLSASWLSGLNVARHIMEIHNE